MINIRHENKNEFKLVEAKTCDAFCNLYVPGCNEHLIVHHLRDSADYIPDLSFIIEKDGEIIGSIFYSKSKIVTDTGSDLETITFGSVSIVPKFQGQGYGRQLITYTIAQAKATGYAAIIIGGYPKHYERYGFVGAKKYKLRLADGDYYTGMMALPLKAHVFEGKQGIIQFSAVLEDSPENELMNFDQNFSNKEKLVTASQREFEQAVAEIDTREF